MRLPYLGLFLLLLAFVSQPSFAQEDETAPAEETEPKRDKDVEKAYDAFEAREYTTAIELLKIAFGEVRGREDKSTILFMLGECYRNVNDYKNAEKNYQKAGKLGYKDPVAKLYYADMLKAQGEYEDAIVAYTEYKKQNPTDPMGEIGIESTKKAVEWQNSPSLYQVSNMEEINSRNMDFSPMYGGKAKDNNVVIFVSSREESMGNKEDGWTGESFMDLYTTSSERKKGRGRGRKKGGATDVLDVSKLGWSTPVPLDEEEILNTVQHEGSATFDSRKKKLYFTKCVKEKEQQLGCGIWITEKVGQSWKQPEPLIIGKDSSSNVGHPSLSPDDKLLYFVSTDYSSRGGRDIFVTSFDRKAKAWKTPKNLGPKINTERDEYYPHANKDGYLYFSSNGLPGMGGLDIYRIKVGKDGLPLADAKPENLKYPVNTNWDDFGIVFEPGGDEKGFLSSNRKGGKGSDDIYAVFKTPVVFNLEGIITSSKTGEVIPEAIVSLVGSDGESIQVTADKEGKYFFGEANIKRDVTYKLTAEKKKFLSNVGDATTVGIPITAFDYLPAETKFLHIVKLNIALDPIDVPIVLPNVFFDLAKANLRPESKIALDTVVTILNNNPRIVIEMRSHTDYRDSEEKNAALSQRRADSCVAYIIKKGIATDRLVARGMGEGEPFVIPAKYKGYGSEALAEGNKLTERFIKTLSAEKQEIANQINRRTDFKVLRDDYVPKKPVVQAGDGETGGDTKAQDEPEEAAPGEIYIIEKRESFGIIARKNKISIQQLKKLNGGLRGVRAVVGLQLKIDPKGDYTEWDETHYQVKKRNENFKSIAKQFDMDDDDLEDLNPDMDPKKLAPGIWVKIK